MTSFLKLENHMDDFKLISFALRLISLDMVLKAKSGHIGAPLGCADLGALLYFKILQEEDTFILSNGHCSSLLYALLFLSKGSLTWDDLKNFRQLGSHTPGHPERDPHKGIICTTGPLGQGLAMAVGQALSSRYTKRPGHVYCIAGDGCLMEGVALEAVSFAGHQKVPLTVLWDDNNITIDGHCDLSTTDHKLLSFESYGWQTQSIDGHNFKEIDKALQTPHSQKPLLISCKTLAGYGSPYESLPKVHGNPLTADDVISTKKSLYEKLSIELKDFNPDRSFEIPQKCWDSVNLLNSFKSTEPSRISTISSHKNPVFSLSNMPPLNDQVNESTRVLNGKVMDHIISQYPNFIGGSADLAQSTLGPITQKHAQYIPYGVREHAMAAISNGLSLYEDLVPFCSTFLVFSDYLKPALRLSCLMNLPVVYIFTHDSFYVGEDGPTHQPIEHLTSLRSIPNLTVYRPCSAFEVTQMWKEFKGTPSAFILTRQALPPLGFVLSEEQEASLKEYGAYVLKAHSKNQKPKISFLASGSEVSLSLEALKLLPEFDIEVISAPKWPGQYEKVISPESQSVICIEASEGSSLAKYGKVIGINGFGASGKAEDLAKAFGFTPETIVPRILKILKNTGIS